MPKISQSQFSPNKLYSLLKQSKGFLNHEQMKQMIYDNNAFLTRDIILDHVKRGIIKINPFNLSNLGNASYDGTLDHTEFRRLKSANELVPITNDVDYKNYTEIFRPKNNLLYLAPGETILARTREIIELPNNIIGAIDGRSRFARMFLTVHTTATYIQPGTSNRQILEISNIGRHTLALHTKDLRICQIYFMRCSGSAPHRGRYTNEQKW